MRILLLTVDFPPSAGGIQNLLAHLSAGLAASHEVCVVAPRREGDAAFDRACAYQVARAPRATYWPLVMFWFWVTASWRALRRPPDLIVCGHVLLGPACWSIARMFGVPFVVVAHAYEIRAPRMLRLAGWTLRQASHVVAVSRFTKQNVVTHGVPADRVTVINPGGASRPTERPLIHRSDTERIILTVARLGELYKGHDMMIRALPLILSKEPHARYVIVGDGPLRSYLERLAVSVGVARAVTFAGEVSDADLDSWYGRADVFVMLSRESPIDGGAEGFGLTFIEAGAWGKPVVAGRSGGIPDAVIDGVTGLLVDPLNAGVIADAVLRVLGDPELAHRLGAAGRDRAVHDLAWPRFISAFERVVQSAVGPAVATRGSQPGLRAPAYKRNSADPVGRGS